MLSPDKIAEAQRLLAQRTLSQRAIANLLHLSRWSVARIAHGTRPDYEALRARRLAAEEEARPLKRCLQCGRRMAMPCLACQVEERAVHRASAAPEGGPIAIELVGRQRQRYERLRQRYERLAAQHRQEERVVHCP